MLSKKEFRHQIAVKLETALADFKTALGEKKFKSRIKKASKFFSDHYAPSTNGSSNGVAHKKVASKVAPKKAAAKAAPKKAVKKAAPGKKAAEPVKP